MLRPFFSGIKEEFGTFKRSGWALWKSDRILGMGGSIKIGHPHHWRKYSSFFPRPQSFHLPKYLLIKMLSIAIGRRELPVGTANAAGAILPPGQEKSGLCLSAISIAERQGDPIVWERKPRFVKYFVGYGREAFR